MLEDAETRRMVSDLSAQVESEGKATRAAIDGFLQYLKASQKLQEEQNKRFQESIESLDKSVASLDAMFRKLKVLVDTLYRNTGELAISVSRIATTGGVTGGTVVGAIMALASLIHGCGQ